jgi:ABC-type lipoprotein export system ATPase subunit
MGAVEGQPVLEARSTLLNILGGLDTPTRGEVRASKRVTAATSRDALR